MSVSHSTLEELTAQDVQRTVRYLRLLDPAMILTQGGELEFTATGPEHSFEKGAPANFSSLDRTRGPQGYNLTLKEMLGTGAISEDGRLTRNYSDERAAYIELLADRLKRQEDRLQRLRGRIEAHDRGAAREYMLHYPLGELRQVFREVANHQSAERVIGLVREAYLAWREGNGGYAFELLSRDEEASYIVARVTDHYYAPGAHDIPLTQELVNAYFEEFDGPGKEDIPSYGIQRFWGRIREMYDLTLDDDALRDVLLGNADVESLGIGDSHFYDHSISDLKQGLLPEAVREAARSLGVAVDEGFIDSLSQASPEALLREHLPALERHFKTALPQNGFHHLLQDIDFRITHVRVHFLAPALKKLSEILGREYDLVTAKRRFEIQNHPVESFLHQRLAFVERLAERAVALLTPLRCDFDALLEEIDHRIAFTQHNVFKLEHQAEGFSNDDLANHFRIGYDALVLKLLHDGPHSPVAQLRHAWKRIGLDIEPFWPAIEYAALRYADYKKGDHGEGVQSIRMNLEPVQRALVEALGKNAYEEIEPQWSQVKEALRQFMLVRSYQPQELLLLETQRRAAEKGIVIKFMEEGGPEVNWEIALQYNTAEEGARDLKRVKNILKDVAEEYFPGLTLRLRTSEFFPNNSQHITNGVRSQLLKDAPQLADYLTLAQTQYLFEEGNPRAILAFANTALDYRRYGGTAAPVSPFSSHEELTDRYMVRLANFIRVRVQKDGLYISENRLPGVVEETLAGAMSLKPFAHGVQVYTADVLHAHLTREGNAHLLEDALRHPPFFRVFAEETGDPVLQSWLRLSDGELQEALAPVAAKLEKKLIVPGRYAELLELYKEQPRMFGKENEPGYPFLAYIDPGKLKGMLAQIRFESSPNGHVPTEEDIDMRVRRFRDLLCGQLPSLKRVSYEETVQAFAKDALLDIDMAPELRQEALKLVDCRERYGPVHTFTERALAGGAETRVR